MQSVGQSYSVPMIGLPIGSDYVSRGTILFFFSYSIPSRPMRAHVQTHARTRVVQYSDPMKIAVSPRVECVFFLFFFNVYRCTRHRT